VNGLDQDSQETISAVLKANEDLNADLQASESKYGALRRVMERLVGWITRWGPEERMLRQKLATAQRAEEEMRNKLDEERKAKEDSQKDLEASRRRIDALEGDLERVRGERDTLHQECAEMRRNLDKERKLRSTMEANVQLFMQQHIKHPPSDEAPLLYAFAGNTSADKYTVRPSHSTNTNSEIRCTDGPTPFHFFFLYGSYLLQALMEHLVRVAVEMRDVSGLLAPFSAETPSSLSKASVLLYVMCISTSRLDEACKEYMDHRLIQHAAAQGGPERGGAMVGKGSGSSCLSLHMIRIYVPCANTVQRSITLQYASPTTFSLWDGPLFGAPFRPDMIGRWYL
jgi:hypothetical protein